MLDLLFLPLFVNPAFPDSNIMYDSGIKEVEHSYASDAEAKQYPFLRMDIMAQDSNYNIIKPGIYALDLSADCKTLLLFQGAQFIAEARVVQKIELEHKQPVPETKIGFIKNNTVIIIYKKDELEVHGILYKFSPN